MIRNRYTVLREVGRGGMGAVYLVEDTQLLGRRRGVKELLLPTDPGEIGEAESNFRREAQLLAKVSHPRIPDIHEYFTENGRYYLVMEWVEGENLEQKLAQHGRPLDERQVIEYALQTCEVLEYLASQNPPVIHRDIKPANLIVDTTGQVHLVDFGIARAKPAHGPSAGKDSSVWGTQGYAAPEQFVGLTEARSDVYALGATMHHLLTGTEPQDSSVGAFAPVNVLAPNVSLGATQVVERMLDPIATHRPTAHELRESLANLLDVKPLMFPSGGAVYSTHELADACDQDHATAVQFLKDHHIEEWLKRVGRADLASKVKVHRVNLNRRAKTLDSEDELEAVLRILDPNLPLPQLFVVTPPINLVMHKGIPQDFAVDLQSNRRHVVGQILTYPSLCFTAPDRFECSTPTFRSTVAFRFNPYVALAAPQRATISFKAPHQVATLNVDYTIAVPQPSPRPAPRIPVARPANPATAPAPSNPIARPAIPTPARASPFQASHPSVATPARPAIPLARRSFWRYYLPLLALAPLLACVLGFMGLGTNLAVEVVLIVMGLLIGLVLATMFALLAYILS